MTTQMATNNTGTEVRLREKKTTSRQNGNHQPSINENGLLDSSGSTVTTNPRSSTFEAAFFFGLNIDEALSSSENLLELFYNACKYNHLELVKRCVEEKKVNINEPYNNDYPLCIASHKGHIEVVRYLLAHGANVHLKRELNLLATRGNHRLSRANLTYGDSALSLAIKYGFEDIAIDLIERGSEILNENAEFEKSPLQDAIRLNRIQVLNLLISKMVKMKAWQTADDNLLLQKKGDILRQCLINDQIDALKIFVPHVWRELNSDFMFMVLNNLMLKNKIQSDKAFDVLETILEAIPTSRLKMYDIGDLLRRFLHILQAQFVTINDDRIQILYLRTALLFSILKYHETIDFTEYLELLDAYFRAIYNSVESTGEGVNQIYEYIVRFYENLILMGHLVLTRNSVILKLLECEHVQRMQPIDMYLSWRARNPFLLKEKCRLMVKNSLTSYKRSTIDKLKLDEDTFSYLFYLR